MRKKVFKFFLILILISMLTMTDLFMLGHGIAVALYEELENQNITTNIKNVEFDAYFLNHGEKKHSKENQIESEETLVLNINVKEGVLNDAKIKIENANFEIIKDKIQDSHIKGINVDTNEIELNQIIYHNDIEMEIPIRFRRQENFSEDYFERENTISITGTYKDEVEQKLQGQIKTRMVYKQQTDIKVAQEIEKYLDLGGNKILLQQKITTQVPDNRLPRQTEIISTKVPVLNQEMPENVVVLFNGEKLEDEKIEYNKEQKTVSITNQSTNTWGVETNYYKIIYTYDGNVVFDTKTIDLSTKVNTKLYTQEEIEKLEEQTVEITPKGNAVSIRKTATDKIYKGFMYANVPNETVWNESNKIEISDVSSIESIKIEKDKEIFLNEAENEFGASNILYQSTKINQLEFERIFGPEGVITIKDENDQEIGRIDKETQADENGNITINYEGEVNRIKIETTTPIKQGEITLNHVRAIKGNMGYSKEQLKKFLQLSSHTKVITNLSHEVAEAKMKLEDTKTEAKIKMNHNNLSTLQTNENIQLLVTLKSDSEQYDLYKNPKVEIILPQALKVNVKNITQLNRQEELSIVNPRLYTNENKEEVICLEFEGEQTSFENTINEGIQVSITLDINIDKATPSQQSEISMKYTNQNRMGETFTNTIPLQLNSKYGVLAINKLSGFNGNQDMIESIDDKLKTGSLEVEAPAKEATQEIVMVNNYESDITDVAIIGKIPSIGEEKINGETVKSTFEMKLKNKIKVEEKAAKVYYSEDVNATYDSSTWKEEIEDLAKARAFKVVLEDNKIATKDRLKLSYQLEIPEGLQANQSTYTNVALTYHYGGDSNTTNSTITLKTQQEAQTNHAIVRENTEDMTVELIGTTGGKALTEGQEIYEGQAIKYVVRITNHSDKDLTNLNIKATQSNAIFYDRVVYHDGWDSNTNEENVDYSHMEENPELKVKEIKIEKVEPGQTVEEYYQFSVAEDVAENETTSGKIQISADGIETKEYHTDTNIIKQAELKLNLVEQYELEDELQTGGNYPFFYRIKNLSNETKKNIILKLEVPEGFSFDTEGLFEPEENEYEFVDYKDNIITLKIPEIKSLETISIRNTLVIEELEPQIREKMYHLFYTATLDRNEYVSNESVLTVHNMASKFVVNQVGSIKGDSVENGDKLDYICTIENHGPNDQDIEISDSVPEGVKVQKANIKIYRISNGEEELIETEEIKDLEENFVMYARTLEANQKCVLVIETIIHTEEMFTDKITNQIAISTSQGLLQCNDITYKVKGITDIFDPDEPNSEMRNSITGIAWLDTNENGLRETTEETLSDIVVALIETETGNIVNNKEGKEMITKTNEEGSYQFNEVEPGSYMVVFQYDTGKYGVTQYQKEGVNEFLNSDVIEKTIHLEGKEQKVAITGTLKMGGQNLENIDAGFIKLKKFDLRLDKYINKIIIQNNKGTTVKQYDKTQLAKVELDSKKMINSTIIIEYGIQITNEGELAGYVNEIADYMPSDLTFSSEMNKSWYQATNGELHTKELSNEILNPGESKNLTITLTKRMNQNNTGTVINTAEIHQASNDFLIEDMDSIPANKVAGEDDMSTAEVIISIRTGGTIMYLFLIVIVIAIIATGIYVIKKEVLTEE